MIPTDTATVKAGVNTIEVPVLARVEGEGALFIKTKGGKLLDLKLKIPEPPRLFEGFLTGRHFMEAPDITARICGICPIAYQMSAVHAMERALGVEIHPQVRALRRLFYCGEWIESHALHVYMLHAPDFLGYQDVRRVQHVNVQRVALDPLPAVEDPSQQADGRVDRDPQRPFQRVNRAHLIGDRADSADPGGDVRGLRKVAAAQKRFEQPGRLEDLQLDVLDAVALELDVQRALALHARQIVHLDARDTAPDVVHARSLSSPAWRNCQAQALKPRNARVISGWLCPNTWNWRLSAAVLVLSMGPKQP